VISSLSREQAWNLREACIENAADLVKDSQILAAQGRWPRAFELAYFAREELAKADLLAVAVHMLLVEPNSLDWERFSSRWEDHKLKSRDAIFTDFLAEEAFILGKVSGVALDVQKEGNEAAALRKKREAALYVDWSDGIQKPSTAITEADAKRAIDVASRQVDVATHMTTEYKQLTAERARELIEEARQIRKPAHPH
jgi:AbiV family abortive infection protein